MTQNLKETLEGLGLETNEASLYLSLLENGMSSVADLAAKSGIKRTTIYYLLEKIVGKGLAYPTVIEKKTFYIPENPEIIVKNFQEKVTTLKDSLQHLKALYEKQHKSCEKVSFLNGEEGFKKIWQVLFASGVKEYLIITDPREMLGFVRKNYITGKVIKEKVKLGIKSRQLLNQSDYAREVAAKDPQENRISKFLPYDKRIYFTKIIFGDHVAMISPNADEVILLLFQSRFLAKTERELFETIWENLPAIDYDKLGRAGNSVGSLVSRRKV